MSSINIAKDFTRIPGPRYRYEGEYSGEEFRERLLDPAFQESRITHSKLIVNFDGGYGYGTSFLEEAFGGMARKYGISEMLDVLDFISEDDISLPNRVRKYIIEAKQTRKL